MKIFAILILTVIALNIQSRRLDHFGLHSYLSHYAQDTTDIQKKIFRDVLTDKDITDLIVNGKTQDPQFKKIVLQKTIDILSSNDSYLKQLSQKIFSKSNLNIKQEDRIKILKLVLKDKQAADSIMNKNDDVTYKRLAELIKQDTELMNNIGKQTKLDKDNKLSDNQKTALFKIFLNNPHLISKQTVNDEELASIMKEIENDTELKDFYEKSQENKSYIKNLITRNT